MVRLSECFWVSVACVVGAGGCAESAPSQLANLAKPVTISSTQVELTSQLTVTATGSLSKGGNQVTLPVAGLELLARTGRSPALETLSIPLNDVDISAERLPPNGLKLRKVVLDIPAAVPAQVVHAQDNALELRVQTPLRLSWSMVLPDGSLYALAPSKTQPLALDLQVTEAGGPPKLTIETKCEGTCWGLGGLASFENGSLWLESAATVTTAAK
jgi:hypothetical protein